MSQSIIACHQTLIELVRDPDCNQDYEEFDQCRDALATIKDLIRSDKVSLYILPSSLIIAYVILKKKSSDNYAKGAIADILALGSFNCNIDYSHVFDVAISLSSNLDSNRSLLSTSLYESFLLPVALEMNVNALVVTESGLLDRLSTLSNDYPHFKIPILSVREAADYFKSLPKDEGIMVRTPKNRIVHLKEGATVIDFAYAVHTEIGSKCIGALVNGLESPLDRVLTTNDLVEIIQGEDSQVDNSWLDFAQTRNAKKSIKQGLRRKAQKRGRDLVKSYFNIRSVGPRLDILARNRGLTTNRLMEEIGDGSLTIEEVSESLQRIAIDQVVCSSQANHECFVIGGNHEHLQPKLSSCCKPFPEDDSVGIIGINDGMIRIHRRDCANIVNVQSEKLIDVVWSCSCCSVEISLKMKDRPGALVNIYNYILNETGLTTNIRTVQTANPRNAQPVRTPARSVITLSINSRSKMDQIVEKLQSMPNVIQVNVKQIYPTSDAVEE